MTFSYSLLTWWMGLVWTPSNIPWSLGTWGIVCISSTKSTSVLTSSYVLRNPHFLKGEEKSRVIGQSSWWVWLGVQVPLSVLWKRPVFLWFELIQLQLLASWFCAFAFKVRAFDVRKFFPSPKSGLWRSAHRAYSVDKPNTENLF